MTHLYTQVNWYVSLSHTFGCAGKCSVVQKPISVKAPFTKSQIGMEEYFIGMYFIDFYFAFDNKKTHVYIVNTLSVKFSNMLANRLVNFTGK